MNMPTLEWSEALQLELPQMDETHREFVELLAAVQSAPDDELLPRWQGLVTHTVEHFGQEDRWMRETGYAGENCHTVQHRVVLQVMNEGATRAAAGDLPLLRLIAGELAQWFPQHAQSMDAGLALHLRSVGHDPASGRIERPDAVPAQAITGCGSAACT